MKTTLQPATSEKQTVLAFIKALNAHDYKTAKSYTSNQLMFKGPMASREGADAYFQDMEQMQLHYDVKKVFDEGDDVCLLYDVTMAGTTFFAAGWYTLKNDKIASILVVFDPRPLLEKAN